MGNGFNMLPFMYMCGSLNGMFPFLGNAVWGASQQTGWLPPGCGVLFPSTQGDYYPGWGTFERTIYASKAVKDDKDPDSDKVKGNDSDSKGSVKGTETPPKSDFETLKTKLTTYKAKIEDNTKRTEIEAAISQAKTVAELEAVLKTYNDDFASAILELKKEDITKMNDKDLQDEVKALNSALKGSVLAEGDVPNYDFSSILLDGNWKAEIDILDFISTWNSSLSGTDKKHIMVAIKDAYNQAKQANNNEGVGKIKALADVMHDKLIAEASDLYNKINLENISEEDKGALTRLKNGLNKAKADLQSFNNMDIKFNDTNYSDAFNNLYQRMRVLEARNEDAQIKAIVDVADDSTLLSVTKSDLSTENIAIKELKVTVSVSGSDGQLKEQEVDSDVVKQRRDSGYQQTEFANVWYKENKYYYDSGEILKELVGVTKIEKVGNNLKCYYSGNIEKNLDEAKVFMQNKTATQCNGIYRDSANKFYYFENNNWVEITNCVHVTADGKCYSNWEGEGKNGNIQIGLYKNGKYSIEQKDRTDVKGSKYDEGKKIAADLWDHAYGGVSNGAGRAILLDIEQINKETIVGIFAWDFEQQDMGKSSIMKRMSHNYSKDMTNRLVKALMRKAYSLGLQDKESYKKLADYFGVAGTPAYEEDGYSPSGSDCFVFNKSTGGKGQKYYYSTVEEIYGMTRKLYDDIIALAPATPDETGTSVATETPDETGASVATETPDETGASVATETPDETGTSALLGGDIRLR